MDEKALPTTSSGRREIVRPSYRIVPRANASFLVKRPAHLGIRKHLVCLTNGSCVLLGASVCCRWEEFLSPLVRTHLARDGANLGQGRGHK